MEEWLGRAFQGHEMYCHNMGPEVKDLNSSLVKLGVRSRLLLSKSYLNYKQFILLSRLSDLLKYI